MFGGFLCFMITACLRPLLPPIIALKTGSQAAGQLLGRLTWHRNGYIWVVSLWFAFRRMSGEYCHWQRKHLPLPTAVRQCLKGLPERCHCHPPLRIFGPRRDLVTAPRAGGQIDQPSRQCAMSPDLRCCKPAVQAVMLQVRTLHL